MTYKDKKRKAGQLVIRMVTTCHRNTWKCKMKKRWKMKRNNTTKQGKAYIGMYKKPVK